MNRRLTHNLKDFALDPSEERMTRAAHLMIQCLAGSLALVTSKEPFRISMANHLKLLSTQSGMENVCFSYCCDKMQSMSEALIQATVQDQLNFGCSIIEKAAMEKSVAEVTDALAPAIAARARQQEVRRVFIFPLKLNFSAVFHGSTCN